jgi:hypothetical protein
MEGIQQIIDVKIHPCAPSSKFYKMFAITFHKPIGVSKV